MAEDRVKTIVDIARLAGVSKATVSRALNDSPLVSAATRGRILAIAQEHGFEMNDPARRLSLRQSNVVALVTYRYAPSVKLPDAFVLEVMSGLTASLHVAGYDLLVIQIAPGDTDWVSRYRDSGRVEGFVLLAAQCTREHLATLSGRHIPFVLWGEQPDAHEYCSVTGDSLAGGRIATERLLEVGRRRIAFLGGLPDEAEVKDRHGGYLAALAAAGLAPDDALVAYGDWRAESGQQVMEELLARAPDIDGVFACSDLMALGAIDALRAHGLRVPDDVAVVGYDDVALAAHSDPPLTTIRQSGPVIGRLLAETLIQHLRTGAVANVSIPAELVVRGSA
ncbi:MAG: LacI family DNA-binding transcriptional regulator [Solirubrobacteraceae bacterium]|jgi:DNA-binding LacI/PurR family transcriptional regulator